MTEAAKTPTREEVYKTPSTYIESGVKYVLAIVSEHGRESYLGKAEWSDYSLNYNHIRDAIQFDSPEEIKKIIATHPEFNKRTEWDDYSGPPHLQWDGLGICYDLPKVSGHFVIQKVTIEDVEYIPVSDGFIPHNKCKNCGQCSCASVSENQSNGSETA